MCFGSLDENVNSFEDSIVDFGGEPAEDAVLMFSNGFGDFDHGGKSTVSRPEISPVKERFGVVGVLVKQVLEVKAHLVGPCRLQMGIDCVEAVECLPLASTEVLRVFKPDVTAL